MYRLLILSSPSPLESKNDHSQILMCITSQNGYASYTYERPRIQQLYNIRMYYVNGWPDLVAYSSLYFWQVVSNIVLCLYVHIRISNDSECQPENVDTDEGSNNEFNVGGDDKNAGLGHGLDVDGSEQSSDDEADDGDVGARLPKHPSSMYIS